MKAIKQFLVAALMMAIAASGAEAQLQQTSSNYQLTRSLLQRIENRNQLFRDSLSIALDRNPVSSRGEENIAGFRADFEAALRQFHQRLNARLESASDAQLLLSRAALIDGFMRRHVLDARTQNYWTTLKGDLDRLGSLYGVSLQTAGDTNGAWPPYSSGQLTGTYRLDPYRSDNPQDAIDRALRSLPYGSPQQTRQQITARLDSPDQIAIEQRGRTVTLASTRAPQITFDADGRERSETTPSGHVIRTRAAFNGDDLTVTSIGERNNEFEVTLAPTQNARQLQVTKRVYLDNSNMPLVVQSVYNRVSDVARFEIYRGPQAYPTSDRDAFIIRDGETVVAELSDTLTTRAAREGDRFTATVRLPTQYAGATIEGHVANISRSGRITGRSEMTFNFDRIRLRDGRSYQFAGIVENVRLPNGETANVDNEGAVREDSQGTKTAERAAIGTAVGAIIGAIAGGGKGAAIGAVIGATGGAGSVYIQGPDDLDLPRGTEITIRATGPRS